MRITIVPSIFKFLSFINCVEGLLTGGRTRTMSEIKWPGPHLVPAAKPVLNAESKAERVRVQLGLLGHVAAALD